MDNLFYAVVNGKTCIEVPEYVPGAFCSGGSFWVPENSVAGRRIIRSAIAAYEQQNARPMMAGW